MKKIIIINILFIFSFTASNACEICGCGLGNYYIGLMPQFHKHFIGLRYQYRNFHTVMNDDPTQYSRDFYKTTELWGGFNFGNRWQAILILPYNFVHQVSDDGVKNNQGIGDVALMANYKMLDINSMNAHNKAVSQQLWFGVGVKLPTGKFDIDATDPAIVSIANTQAGSASTDFMLNAMYNVRISKMGINTSASYKMNTSNKDGYAYGNKFSASSFVYYAMNKKQVGITPNAGVLFETSGANRLVSHKIDQTGGHLVLGSAGLELSVKQFTLGGNVQLPIGQQFSGGQTESKARGMLHLTFSL